MWKLLLHCRIELVLFSKFNCLLRNWRFQFWKKAIKRLTMTFVHFDLPWLINIDDKSISNYSSHYIFICLNAICIWSIVTFDCPFFIIGSWWKAFVWAYIRVYLVGKSLHKQGLWFYCFFFTIMILEIRIIWKFHFYCIFIAFSCVQLSNNNRDKGDSLHRSVTCLTIWTALCVCMHTVCVHHNYCRQSVTAFSCSFI